MAGPDHIFALSVSARLGSSGGLLRGPAVLEIFLDLLCVAHIDRNQFLYLLSFFKVQSALAFLFLQTSLQLLVVAIHGLPFRSLDTFEHGLTNGMSVFVHEGASPSTVSHTRGVDEGA